MACTTGAEEDAAVSYRLSSSLQAAKVKKGATIAKNIYLDNLILTRSIKVYIKIIR